MAEKPGDKECLSPLQKADAVWTRMEENERDYPFLVEKKAAITEKRKQLESKEVIISVFGRHNCGKSTLLNAILKNSLLPALMDRGTSIELKIRHDGSVHPGHCNKSCSEDKCPRLEEITNDGTSTVKVVTAGATAIEAKIDRINAEFRRKSGAMEEGKSFLLFTYAPVLAGAPDGWTVTLVDTPGFGEANVDEIMKHTDMLFNTSAGYLYLMDCTCLGDKVDSDNIKLLLGHDKDIFRSGKLIVCVNKHDLYLSDKLKSCSLAITDAVKCLEEKTRSFINETVVCESDIEVVSVSAEWACNVRMFHANPSEKRRKRKIKTAIEEYPEYEEKSESMEPEEMAEALEEMSQILTLEKRIKMMVEKGIDIWRTSLINAYSGYLSSGLRAIEDLKKLQEEEIQSAKRVIKLSKSWEMMMNEFQKRGYEERRGRFNDEYKKETLDNAKRSYENLIKDEFDAFISDMRERIKDVQISQQDFMKRASDFHAKLKNKIHKHQENIKVDWINYKFISDLDEMNEEDRVMEEKAKEFLPKDFNPPAYLKREREAKRKKDYENCSENVKTVTIGDIHQEEKAPAVDVEGYITWFMNGVRRLGGWQQYYDQWTSEMKELVSKMKEKVTQVVYGHLEGPLQEYIVDFFFKEYKKRVKDRHSAIYKTYNEKVTETKRNGEESMKELEKKVVPIMNKDIYYLKDALTDLETYSKTHGTNC